MIKLDRLIGLPGLPPPRMIRPVVAALAALLTAMSLPAQAQAEPNYDVFLQSIASDGIAVQAHEAITEGQAVCKLMRPPNDGSLWDAGQQVLSTHPDWGVHLALKFADRSVQNICPNRGSF